MANAKTKELKVKGIDTLKLRLTEGEYDYSADTKMAGKKYRIAVYNGHAFTTNDSILINAIATGNVHEADFVITDADGDKPLYDCVGYVTREQFSNFTKANFQNEMLQVKNFIANPELLGSVNAIEKILEAS